MVLIEAHTSKLPIVSFDINCGPDEIITDGKNGYLIEPFDIEKMAQTINHLIENPEIRKNMSANTYLDKEKLSITTIIKQWKSLFDEEELK
jgi:glycosyltransferase involved in cell wall biosynthesis